MSNALALAHVTQALALLIESNLRPEIDMAVTVEARRPPAEPPREPTVTVFLYRVTPNESRRNDDLPTRAPDGRLLQRAAAAVDLHFLISAYGEENELVAERLIGCVVRTLHEFPVLPRDVIEEAGTRPHLARSDFASDAQRVRFTPTELDVDETSKLWGMLHQTPYALSVAYQASLVRIEGREEPVPAPPVRERTVHAQPFAAPGTTRRATGPVPAGETSTDAGPTVASETGGQPGTDQGDGTTAGTTGTGRGGRSGKTPARKAATSRAARSAEPERKPAPRKATSRTTARGGTGRRTNRGTGDSGAGGARDAADPRGADATEETDGDRGEV